ncbi:MAG: hypothetical protein L7S55_08915 [Luminiphilus sp.]|nr:hypothetical protein [Luminiphilus sp.]
MDCLKCGKGSRVVDSKKTAQRITRRRECIACLERWNTTEHRDGAQADKHKAKPIDAVKPTRVTTHTKRRVREELYDLREHHDSDLPDILDDLGVFE